ncbi:MAG: hypothetical protein ACTSSH_01775 [Candidatus Heimdallarchaeota archaeon]
MVKIYDSINYEKINHKVSLVGKAVNSKAGACIQLSDGNIVFIQNVPSWDDEYFKKEIIVTGKLFDKKIIPDVYVEEDGSISQGALGTQLILEDIKEIKLA